MTDETKPKKPTKKKCVALKALNCDGMKKKGESFTCSEKEYSIFKKAKAV